MCQYSMLFCYMLRSQNVFWCL